MKKSAWRNLAEASFGLGKSGAPRHEPDPDDMPFSDAMRPPRNATYTREIPDRNPKASRRDHMVGLPQDESSGGGDIVGMQAPLSPEDALRAVVRKKVKEIVRKKKGGGGYILYSPNMGKKKPPKAVGEYPTRGQAKKAEMLRFPPKDPRKRKALKRSVDRLRNKRESVERLDELRDRLAEAAEDAMEREPEDDTAAVSPPPSEPDHKSPEDASAEMGDDGEDGAQTGVPADDTSDEPEGPVEPSARPATTPQEESRWEDLLGKLSDVAVKKDPRLRKLVKRVADATERSLEKSVKTLGRMVSGVTAGKTGKDRVGRTYITAKIEPKSGTTVGPIFIYVKGETLHVVSDGKVKSAIMKLEPDEAKEVREALRDLPDRFDAKDLERAVAARDSYLEDMEMDLDGYLSELDAMELSMLKRLVADKYSGDEEPIE